MGRSVILVHGILGQRHLYWNVFKRRLESSDIRYHDCVLPYGMLGDLRIAAGYLRDKVRNALRHDDADRVDLVCHSAGGLVARYYLKFLGGDAEVGHLVTLGSPHQGTVFSYAMPAPLVQVAKQTRPGSHFLHEIAGPPPAGVQATNIWSPIDGVVVPSRNAAWEGADEVVLHWATHWSLLWRRDVFETVLAALQK